jgi:hypothetical protein
MVKDNLRNAAIDRMKHSHLISSSLAQSPVAFIKDPRHLTAGFRPLNGSRCLGIPATATTTTTMMMMTG